MSETACCTHPHVSYQTETLPVAGTHGWWACDDCGKRFAPISNTVCDGEKVTELDGCREYWQSQESVPPVERAAMMNRAMKIWWEMRGKDDALAHIPGILVSESKRRSDNQPQAKKELAMRKFLLRWWWTNEWRQEQRRLVDPPRREIPPEEIQERWRDAISRAVTEMTLYE